MKKHGIIRRLRKLTAIVIGLALGWTIAELAFNQVPQASNAAMAATAAAAPEGDHPKPVGGEVDHAKHDHHAPASVMNLKPGEGQTPWFGTVVWYAILLFVLAAALGPLVIALKGPDLPEPVAKHDAHGHDDHGHSKDAHGGGH
ncbi:MAG: hypothetical protein WD768_06070 [Phycisphaeraceae bacterium]